MHPNKQETIIFNVKEHKKSIIPEKTSSQQILSPTESNNISFARVLKSEEIHDKEKTEFIADLEIMKEESAKKKPNRKLFPFALPTIERLSAYAQIGSFIYQILPTIQSFIASLPQVGSR